MITAKTKDKDDPRSNHIASLSTILARIMQARSQRTYFSVFLADLARRPRKMFVFLHILQENSENLASNTCKKTCKIFISCKKSCKITIILQEILQGIKISHLARSLYPAEYLAIQPCKMLLLEDMSSHTLL